MNYKKVITLFLVALSFLCCLFTSCDLNNRQKDTTFVSCTFDASEDQIILSNANATYKLSIWLYGKQIVSGEYQVFGSKFIPFHKSILQQHSNRKTYFQYRNGK